MLVGSRPLSKQYTEPQHREKPPGRREAGHAEQVARQRLEGRACGLRMRYLRNHQRRAFREEARRGGWNRGPVKASELVVALGAPSCVTWTRVLSRISPDFVINQHFLRFSG